MKFNMETDGTTTSGYLAPVLSMESRTSGWELNGTFLSSYDGRRAEPENAGSVELYRENRLQNRREDVILQKAAAGEIANEATRTHPELILDESNLLPFDFLRTGDRLGRAVVKIQRGDGAAGTGFLVAPGILLTNHHVLPDVATAASARAVANFEVSPPNDPSGRSHATPLDPDALFVTNAELDFTFCGVNGLDFLGVVPLNRNSLNIVAAEYVNIIQHPRGRPKEVALQDSQVVKADNVVVHYSCDTEPGSSGSPVFNNQWRLVALHHASIVTDDPQGRRASGANPALRYLNEGIRLSAIAIWLETAEANTPALRDQVARLRASFSGLDPQIGFFGALGRHARGRNAAEVVVESYRKGADDLDLAFWNLKDIRRGFTDRLSDIGWVLAEMGVDLWFLSHINAAQARMLCEHLESHYQLEYRHMVVRGVSGPALAVIYRLSEGLTVDRSLHVLDGATNALRARATSGQGRLVPVELIPICRDATSPLVPDRLPGPEPGTMRVWIGDGLTETHLRSLADSGRVAVCSAIGRDGALAVIAGPDAAIGPIFASPNLSHISGSTETFHIVRDRQWPCAIQTLGGHRPIALRIVLDAYPTSGHAPRTSLATFGQESLLDPSLDPRIERTLRNLVQRIVAESRGQSVTDGSGGSA